MGDLTLAQQVAVMAIPLLFAITTHEVAHGWVASRLGDKTALMLGRITFNPVKHIDPVGTLLVPALLILMKTGIIFGWAKPVPVNHRNLNNPKRDMAIVAAAGPLTNLIMAFMWAAILKFVLYMVTFEVSAVEWVAYMSYYGVLINLWLMIINFLPIPPLDGSRLIEAMLPGRLALQYSRIEPFGIFIFLGLIYFGLLRFLMPILAGFVDVIFSLFHISPSVLRLLGT